MNPAHTQGPGALLRRLLGPAGVELVDIGEPGNAYIQTEQTGDGPLGVEPTCVRILSSQRDEQMTMSAATGCALYVAWAAVCIFGENAAWDRARIQAVALAIALPQEALRESLRQGLSVSEIAHVYRISPLQVAQRIRMLHGHDSGEQPALSDPGDDCKHPASSVVRVGWDDTSRATPDGRSPAKSGSVSRFPSR